GIELLESAFRSPTLLVHEEAVGSGKGPNEDVLCRSKVRLTQRKRAGRGRL
ncbi:hypothetical protein AVEN_174839-1, partial [Araneus ventricosus]